MAEKKSGLSLKTWLLIVLGAVLLIIALQNTESVDTQILFLTMRMPRFVLLGMMLLLGFAIGIFMARRPKPKVEIVERS